MRSYYAHLKTTEKPKDTAIAARPVHRSSAIFPALQSEGITSRILFLGYWRLKRHIESIDVVATLRADKGNIVSRKAFPLVETRAYSLELKEMLGLGRLDITAPFTGSLEIEFFSSTNLVFSFPATVINYYGPSFCTFVHTAERVYNDFEDRSNNSRVEVPEAGFNIYVKDAIEPFISLINGGEQVEGSMKLQFINQEGASLTETLPLGTLEPYETRLIYPAREVPLKEFLKGQVGTVKATFHLPWVFPRLVVGNVDKTLHALSITHSYYDCTAAAKDEDYWLKSDPMWYPSSLMVPIFLEENRFTNVYFYPIYSPSSFFVDLEIYNEHGVKLGGKKEVLHIKNAEVMYEKIPISALCREWKIQGQNLSARLIARDDRGERIPARIKIGIDVGIDNKGLPCNICANLHPFNPAYEGKKGSFRWVPILADQAHQVTYIMNSSPKVDWKETSEVEIDFYREEDQETFKRRLTLPPHGFLVLRLQDDKELSAFFKGKTGWATVKTTNPYTTTYYFALNDSAVVGGDHGF